MMKSTKKDLEIVTGVVMIIAGIGIWIYVGLLVMFVGGIIQETRANNMAVFKTIIRIVKIIQTPFVWVLCDMLLIVHY